MGVGISVSDLQSGVGRSVCVGVCVGGLVLGYVNGMSPTPSHSISVSAEKTILNVKGFAHTCASQC